MKNLNISLFVVATILLSQFAFAGAPMKTPDLVAKGEKSYKTNCSICHGDKGDGNGPAGGSLVPKARNFVSEKYKFGNKPEQVFKTITNGTKNTSMTGFGHLPEEERWALAFYVLSFKK